MYTYNYRYFLLGQQRCSHLRYRSCASIQLYPGDGGNQYHPHVLRTGFRFVKHIINIAPCDPISYHTM